GGRSTFMVEMQELSNILHSATAESLVVLDEVGRGTATYDGISIAWATTEYIHNELGCKCLFATHYHELTALADHLPRVENVHVAVADDGDDGDITFLRTIEEGPTDRSYGIHVADLAGVPAPVVERSRDVLDRLREDRAIEARGSGDGETTQAVFDLSAGGFREGDAGAESDEDDADGSLDPAVASVLGDLQATSVAETPPVDLVAQVREWQERLDGVDVAVDGDVDAEPEE
ncbi:MAG: DNA mismatch repair protein MutS, partial [Haloplanus sp.]